MWPVKFSESERLVGMVCMRSIGRSSGLSKLATS